jgi:2-amino-4-hydroxy-6-hydroxymethyldihydropteridine diphosphokinase
MASNYDASLKMELAFQKMNATFPNIHWDIIRKTAPHDMKTNFAPFFNQVGCFVTSLPQKELIQHFKSIEKELGRKKEDVENEKICIDIDLLTYNSLILKPEDWKYDYVQEGIKELSQKS